MIPRFNDARDWFFRQRFGMFIHWGIYAVKAFHEQYQWRMHIPSAEYVKLAGQFNPQQFAPEAWLDLCQEAGMEYICFTCKHHDGFCMWDSKFTDYNIMHTPYCRDVLALLAKACHRRGIRLGLYYSCPDWHCPSSLNFGGDHQLPRPNPGDRPDLLQYVDYVKNQVRELCSRYGEISEFFWDIPPGVNFPELNALIRELQPAALINDRGYGPGDYDTPERHIPPGEAFSRPTEACQSVGRCSWGYRHNEDYYSPLFLMQSMDNILARGGNYLLNVGPDAQGCIPAEAQEILRRIGRWYKGVKESFVDTEVCTLPGQPGSDFLVTRRGSTFYLHFLQGFQSSGYGLPAFRNLPQRAVLLNTGATVPTDLIVLPQIALTSPEPRLHLYGLPAGQALAEVPVIRLDFAESIP